jgi:ribonuclease-3
LSRRLARLVSRETCAEVAGEMQLSEHLHVGGGGRKGGAPITQGVLSDVCEAVIAAVYRDAGIEAARTLVARYWGPRVDDMSGSLRDAKTELQEWAHRRGAEGPVYLEVQRSGPDHKPKFEVEVTVAGVAPERGRGGSKREAEHEAAASLLRREGVWEKE